MEEGEEYNHEAVKEMYDCILEIPAGVRSGSAVGLMLVWAVGCIAAGVAQIVVVVQDGIAAEVQWVMDVADIVGIGMLIVIEQDTGWGDNLVEETAA